MSGILAARPVAAARDTAIGFAAGFGFVFRGLRFAYRDHRELARLYLPPMALALLLVAGGLVAFGFLADDVIGWFWAEPAADAWFGFKHLLWRLLTGLLWVILAVATVLSSVVLFSLVAAPWNDLLSERTEGILGTWEPRPFSMGFVLRDAGHTVLLEAARLGIKAAWLLPLFLVSLIIPVLGQIVYVVLGGYLLAKLLGMDYVDWVLARRGYTWKERFAFARRHRFALVGFGTAMVLLLLIPMGFVVFWPAAVTGGTMLAVSLGPEDRRQRDGADASRLDEGRPARS
jgi:CysZ protein